jgi:Kef-type K+ transport system membrane component KefB
MSTFSSTSQPHGYLSHANPLTYDPSNALYTTNGFALFLTQVCIIIILCMILGQAFKRIGQPAVVGELLAGVLLGPTAFGSEYHPLPPSLCNAYTHPFCYLDIPGFSATIIPPTALPLLKLMASIGLSLFLFLVGLETDTDIMAKYLKQVLMITLPGMAIPFAIATGIAKLIYDLEVVNVATSGEVVPKFTTFLLFVATTMAVT